MSEAITALEGAEFTGMARVADAGLHGMITLRGTLASRPVKQALKEVLGLAVPDQRKSEFNGSHGALWMAPDELMLLCPYGDADAHVASMSAALTDEHALVVNVSDARVRLSITGQGAREALGKLMPVDFSRTAFAPGQIRRSRLAQVPAAVWCVEADQFELMAFRSVARYVFDALAQASAADSAVGVY